MTASRESGGHGTLAGLISLLRNYQQVSAQVIPSQQLRLLWLLLVICGCLLLFGISFSTIPAQPGRRQLPFLLATTLPLAIPDFVNRRRKRQQANDPNSQGIAASYARYSSDHQREDSIEDQRRQCREMAERNDHKMQPEFEFADAAVSGTKLHRSGLDALLSAAEARAFKVLYLHSLSRLSRESVITMPLLKRLVHTFGIRVISVTEGIDTSRDGWDVIAPIMSVLHERYIKELGANVFRGQEGTALSGFSVGDVCFGYGSVPIPGSESGRRGRHAKPRMRYEVDESEAVWVRQIFQWYVKERRSISWITQELTRLGAPKDHRATTRAWHHQQVSRLLASPKYIGIWPWGEMHNVRDPLTGNVRQELRPAEVTEKWIRKFPELRIVDDTTFEHAQRLIENNRQRHAAKRRPNGTFDSRQRQGASEPRHLLSGMIVCSECGAKFHVGGSHGKYLFCPGQRSGLCSCKTQLNRKRAERLILNALGQRILENAAWVDAVFQATFSSWDELERKVPAELAGAERSLAETILRIERLLNQIENGLACADVRDRLETRQKEKCELEEQVRRLLTLAHDRGPTPTREWVLDQLSVLGERLRGDTPAATHALRDLVGGKIEVAEVRRDGRTRHYFRARLVIDSAAIAKQLTRIQGNNSTGQLDMPTRLTETIEIDMVDPHPLNEKADLAKSLYDQGLMNAEIAQRLSVCRSMVTKLLQHWFTTHGDVMPDGRGRRSTLERKHLEPPRYQQLAEQAKLLADEGLLLQELAERLKCDIATVTKALRYWHDQHGSVALDGRTRRKTLARKRR